MPELLPNVETCPSSERHPWTVRGGRAMMTGRPRGRSAGTLASPRDRAQIRKNRGLLMTISPPDVLRRLGAGEAIDSVCRATGWSRAEFDAWWRREVARRAPRCGGEVTAAVRAGVVIERDR